MSKKLKTILLWAIIFTLGGGIGFFLEYKISYQQTKQLVMNIKPVRENNFHYTFIYPLLRYDFGDAKYFLEDKTLEQKINAYVQQQYQSKNAESISVYYSNFLAGQWSGVNPTTQYYPGSMMKVLIMMDYYREKQLDQSIMQKTLLYTSEMDRGVRVALNQNSTNLIAGQNYTIKYLIEDMIENSDNGARALLLANDKSDILNAIYSNLKIPSPLDEPDFTISARDYSIFLRILYNSTYLTEINSEAALSIMSKTTFKDGITAGVPSDVLVAHKYGESIDFDPQGKQVTGTELHDCGIIYAKTNPYTLCIMTRAKGTVDQKQLATIIKDISAIVYNYNIVPGGGQ